MQYNPVVTTVLSCLYSYNTQKEYTTKVYGGLINLPMDRIKKILLFSLPGCCVNVGERKAKINLLYC